MTPREEYHSRPESSIPNPDARASPESGDQIKSTQEALEGLQGFRGLRICRLCSLSFVNVASFKILAKLQLWLSASSVKNDKRIRL